MFRCRHTLFAESVLQMADGRLFIAGLYNGLILGPPPGPGAALALDFVTMFECDMAGKFPVSLRLLNTNNTPATSFDMDLSINDPEADAFFFVRRVVVPVIGSGRLRVQYKQGVTDWTDGGSIILRVPQIPGDILRESHSPGQPS